ncbi:phosphate acyltransferase PlsX [Aliivibrio finisterrensis]|uniref:phosphate acyltransferase PlsX n=1 Tax=Aliivibrio finisterrensis TaxID=511998 RepID=UPI0010215759|nr:phosphate acyltransferase PlsX [Aliivibrio finisterrensis]RYU67380.1 phosphate acyltransferase PlsX [Aliivibrio finisterrensis]RYU70674.1 phosphate acyltransferase PlsX [Aliivibrio finisterrensis]RYU73943.1 phosphate acyltransferase PlsX [Aliivibrio finisterrensis]
MQQLTIAIDAMGGDFGPQVTVPAAVQALSQFPELKITIVGDRHAISTQLAHLNYTPSSRFLIVHSDSVIGNNTPPSKALRHSRGSSMRVALDLVSSKDAQACISAGNTGALMGLSRFTLKLLPGVERPALISPLPTKNNQRTWMLDLGANVSCDAETLFQFAVMGSELAEQSLGRKAKVALLNIGEEEIKGNDQIKRCAEMLHQCQDIQFIGYIEGDKLYKGIADVVVCDGFVGNVCLKTSEGVAHLFLDQLKSHLVASKFKQILAKWLFGDVISSLKELNPDQYNGASLIGLRGIVVKSHGSADISAFNNAIKEAVHEVKRQIPNRISDRLEAVLLERHY